MMHDGTFQPTRKPHSNKKKEWSFMFVERNWVNLMVFHKFSVQCISTIRIVSKSVDCCSSLCIACNFQQCQTWNKYKMHRNQKHQYTCYSTIVMHVALNLRRHNHHSSYVSGSTNDRNVAEITYVLKIKLLQVALLITNLSRTWNSIRSFVIEKQLGYN